MERFSILYKLVCVLNNAANLATNITYKPFGGVSSLTYGNGLSGAILYDNQYRISAITVGTAGTILNYMYTHDANGNITAINDILDPTKNKTYSYDALDRLASGKGPWGTLTWTYDGVGNRLTETNGGTSIYAYQAGTNRLQSITGPLALNFSFDNNGNTASELRTMNSELRTYEYNQNQRLIRVVDAGVTKGEYTYNGNGQRVKKVVSGVTTVFHYSLSGQIIAESNSTGAITAEYVYLNIQPLAKIEGSNVYYYHNDHLSTPQKMTDSTGAVVWSADYKPFGEATVTVSTITNNLRFPGQYYDAETGLLYNMNRTYNKDIGRYIEADPWNTGVLLQRQLSLKMSIRVLRPDKVTDLSLYPYAMENPLKFTDPLGLDSDTGGQQQYSCISICLSGLLKDKWGEFQCCAAKAGIAGVSIGTVTCTVIAAFEPYLLPTLLACIGITSASTAALGIGGCMLKLEVGGLGGVAGCIAGCSCW